MTTDFKDFIIRTSGYPGPHPLISKEQKLFLVYGEQTKRLFLGKAVHLMRYIGMMRAGSPDLLHLYAWSLTMRDRYTALEVYLSRFKQIARNWYEPQALEELRKHVPENPGYNRFNPSPQFEAWVDRVSRLVGYQDPTA